MKSSWRWPILIGLVLRLVVFWQFESLPTILDGSVECSTPVTSFKRLQEGVFQFVHNGSPYIGVCHQSPLLLALFVVFPNSKGSSLWMVNVLYSVVDVVTGWLLMKIAEELLRREETGKAKENIEKERKLKNLKVESDTSRKGSDSVNVSASVSAPCFSANIVAAVYLFNPLILLSTFSRSTTLFTNATVAGSIHSAVTGKPARAMVLLGLASTLSYYPIYLAPALALLVQQTEWSEQRVWAEPSRGRHSLIQLGLIFVVSVGSFFTMGYIPTKSWDFVPSTFGVILLFKDLTPNIGLWWYFFTEMFDFFRPFFIGVFQIFVASFSVPVTIRFADKQPLFALISLVGIISVFKSYPEVGDIGFYLSLLALYKPIFSLLRYRLVTGLALLYCSVLAPTFYHLWIYLGSGNSNFFYAITLVHALGMTLMLSDSIWAALRLDYDGGVNKSVSQT